MNRLERRIPPLALALVFAALIVAAGQSLPSTHAPLPANRALAAVCVVAGIAVALLGVLEFRRAGTTVNPLDEGRASTVVSSGIYAWTRNPMYVGMALGLGGVAAWCASVVGYALLPVFVAFLTRFQIVPEERALRATFGRAFDDYAARVRRWI